MMPFADGIIFFPKQSGVLINPAPNCFLIRLFVSLPAFFEYHGLILNFWGSKHGACRKRH